MQKIVWKKLTFCKKVCSCGKLLTLEHGYDCCKSLSDCAYTIENKNALQTQEHTLAVKYGQKYVYRCPIVKITHSTWPFVN